MKKVFTTGQVAKICKVAPRTVSKWFDSGRLRGYRIPGSQDRRIPREHLIHFLKEHGMPLGELEEEGWHKILIIGAEKLFIDRIKELLPEDDDFKYELANSGFEAGIQAESFHPDTIIIDLAMGRSEALQIAQNLRRNAAVRDDPDHRPGQRGRGRPGDADSVTASTKPSRSRSTSPCSPSASARSSRSCATREAHRAACGFAWARPRAAKTRQFSRFRRRRPREKAHHLSRNERDLGPMVRRSRRGAFGAALSCAEWWDLERRYFEMWTSALAEIELRAGTYPGQNNCVKMVRRLRYLPPLSAAGRELLQEIVQLRARPAEQGSRRGSFGHLRYARHGLSANLELRPHG